MRIFSFYHDGEIWTDDEKSLVIERLSKFISYAKEKGIILLHENEKDIYGDNIDRCKDLFENGYEGFLSLEPHLGSFEGLSDLELTDNMTNLPKSGEGTFALAYNSLCKILENIAVK